MAEKMLMCIPDDFKFLGTDGPGMSNLDHTVDKNLAEVLRGEKVFAQYSAWNFYGYVWWDRESNKFNCQIMVYGDHKETLSADNLKEIMEEASDKYGDA